MNREVVLVFGKTGMGKTVFTKQHLAGLSRVLVMDPQGEYEGIQMFDDVADLADRLQRQSRAFRFGTYNTEDFDVLCDVAMAVGNVWLVVEEAQRVLPERTLPPVEFRNVIYRGRHQRVSLLMVSQRPTTVHISARSQWSRMVTFNQTEKNDVVWMQSVSGFDFEPRELEELEYFDVRPTRIDRLKLDVPWRRVRQSGRSQDEKTPKGGDTNGAHQVGTADDGSGSADDLRPESDQLHAVPGRRGSELES